jgi:hypothetical protein
VINNKAVTCAVLPAELYIECEIKLIIYTTTFSKNKCQVLFVKCEVK